MTAAGRATASADALETRGLGACPPPQACPSPLAMLHWPSSAGAAASSDVTRVSSSGAGAIIVAPRGSHSGADARAGVATSHATSAAAIATTFRHQRGTMRGEVWIAPPRLGKRYG